jgi:hypothetical protein
MAPAADGLSDGHAVRLTSPFSPLMASPMAMRSYADLDMIIGNVPLFLEREELETFDIFTYTFGDQQALYLRGQWTVHRNRPEVNEVWRRCVHLGDEIEAELAAKVGVMRLGQPTRFLSAEGCYSHAAVKAGMRIRMATKQAVGLEMHSSEQVLFVAGAVWLCGGDVLVSSALIARLRERTGREPCRASLPPLQRPVGVAGGVGGGGGGGGALTPLPLSSTEAGCGKWIPAEFRMCASGASAVEALREPHMVVVSAQDGVFFTQRLEDAGLELENQCRQVAFFHFQEWKKVWASAVPGADGSQPSATNARIAPLRTDQLLNPPPFRVTTAGVSLHEGR